MSLMILIKEICLILKHYDFPKWLFKGSHLVPKKEKKKGNWFFFFQKKKRKEEVKPHFKKKKFFSKIQFLELRLDLILYERGM